MAGINKGRQLYIDADVLVYESAFAAQKTKYKYKRETFPDADSAKVFCENNELDYKALRKDGTITSEVEVLPESAARNILRMKIDRITDTCKSERTTLLLSGDSNYRDDVAKTKGYKANRANTPKPQHYEYIRSLCIEWGAIVVSGIEADDAIGISMSKDKEGVICTIDKDLNQIPGRHFDWNKGILYNVPSLDSHRWFLRQLLTGDATDNIPGLPKYGDVKAANILDPIKHDHEAMWEAVKAEYKKCEMDETYLNEQGCLLWIQRKPDERWTSKYYTKQYVS